MNTIAIQNFTPLQPAHTRRPRKTPLKIELAQGEIPEKRRNTRYPFATMKIGESFTVPLKVAASARSSACYHARETGRKFGSTKIGGMVKIWRDA